MKKLSLEKLEQMPKLDKESLRKEIIMFKMMLLSALMDLDAIKGTTNLDEEYIEFLMGDEEVQNEMDLGYDGVIGEMEEKLSFNEKSLKKMEKDLEEFETTIITKDSKKVWN